MKNNGLYKNRYRIDSARKAGHDYSADGIYFFTTCVKDQQEILGEIINYEMKLNEFGKIVQKCWYDLINHYKNCVLDEFIIMPNHVHGIIIIKNQISEKRYTLGNIVGSFKSFSARRINELMLADRDGSQTRLYRPFKWQERFYESIIKSDVDLQRVRQYIINNPLRWGKDKNNQNKFINFILNITL